MLAPGQRGELGYQAAHVVAVGIEATRLRERIEHTEVRRGVGPGAGDPLPIAGVLRDVAVDEEVAEVPFTDPPVGQQVFHEERGGDQPEAVGHPAGVGELAHGGVDDRVAGAALFPGLHLGRVGTPRDCVVLRLLRVVDEVGALGEEVRVPVSPGKLTGERLASRRRASDRAHHLPGRDGAEAQVGREVRCGVAAGEVAFDVVAVDPFEERGKPGCRPFAPGRDRCGPVDRRE